jgi:hypothetical protein
VNGIAHEQDQQEGTDSGLCWGEVNTDGVTEGVRVSVGTQWAGMGGVVVNLRIPGGVRIGKFILLTNSACKIESF